MKKFLQGLVATFAFVCLFGFFGQAASAEEVDALLEAPAEIEVPPVEYNAYDYDIRAMMFLKMWGSAIAKAGKNKIEFMVETETYGTVNRVGAKVYLERYSGGSWNQIANMGDHYETNTSSVLIFGDATVSTGYYYRIKAHNYAVNYGIREEAYSNSMQLLMN